MSEIEQIPLWALCIVVVILATVVRWLFLPHRSLTELFTSFFTTTLSVVLMLFIAASRKFEKMDAMVCITLAAISGTAFIKTLSDKFIKRIKNESASESKKEGEDKND